MTFCYIVDSYNTICYIDCNRGGDYMNEIVKSFLNSSKIPETTNHTVEKIMNFLTEPESVQAMILMSELEQPALSGVVKKLEENFAYSDFPLHRNAPDKNAPNRRNVGWMVKYVMREFGYTPIREDSVQTRIGKFSKASHFSTAAVYEKTIENPNYILILGIEKK